MHENRLEVKIDVSPEEWCSTVLVLCQKLFPSIMNTLNDGAFEFADCQQIRQGAAVAKRID